MVLLIVVLRVFGPTINLQLGIPTDILNVISLILIGLTWLIWVTWAFFWSGGTVVYRFLLAATILALGLGVPMLFEFETTGDVKLTGVKWRSWKPRSLTIQTIQGVAVDLSPTSPNDFPGFLGKDRSGYVAGPKLESDWAKHPPQLLWKIPVGDGWSGIVAVNGFAVTLEQRGADECVCCYRMEDGQAVWAYRNPRRHDDRGNMGYAGPRSTPTIDAGKVYCQGATGTLMCLDGANGQLIWKQEVDELVGSVNDVKTSLYTGEEFRQERMLSWGRSLSPLIVGDLVITGGGGKDKDSLVTLIAFDKSTGKEIWRGGDDMIAYGSPTRMTLAGQEQIVITAENHVLAVEPKQGRQLWKFPFSGNSTGDANCSQATYVSDQEVLVSKGYGRGGKLVRISGDSDRMQAEEVWSNPRVLRTKLTNPVLRQGFAYALSDGFLECVEVATGELKWKERAHAGNGQLLVVDDLLLVHSEHGKLLIARANPNQFEKLGEVPTVQGICWNTFCVSGPYVLVRSNQEMACFRLAMKP